MSREMRYQQKMLEERFIKWLKKPILCRLGFHKLCKVPTLNSYEVICLKCSYVEKSK